MMRAIAAVVLVVAVPSARADLAADCAAAIPKGERVGVSDDHSEDKGDHYELVPAGALSGTQRGIGIVLAKPLSAVTLQLPGGIDVVVHDAAATGDAALVKPAVCYRRSDGVALWSSREDSYSLAFSAHSFSFSVSGLPMRANKGTIEVGDRLVISSTVPLSLSGTTISGTGKGLVSVKFTGHTWKGLGNQYRAGATTTVLPDGRALVVGGWNQRSDAGSHDGQEYTQLEKSSTLVFDPKKDTLAAGPPLATPRHGHTATALADGRVLVVAGDSVSGPLASAEIFDPAANRWSPAGSLPDVRRDHAAVRLADGRVLVAGGIGIAAAMSRRASIFDPKTGAWTRASDMDHPRAKLSLTLLADGRVLAVAKTAAIYDPKSDRWEATTPPAKRRFGHAAARLADGRVLVAGGEVEGSGAAPTAAEIFDPRTRTWSPAAAPAIQHEVAKGLVFPDGRVAILGGYRRNGPHGRFVEIYDPAKNAWSFASGWHFVSPPGGDAELALLADGRLLVVGSADPNDFGAAVCDRGCY